MLRKVILFSLPLFGSMLLQLLFNAADLVIVGQFASHQALAAVGSTSSLIHLLINLLNGLAIGASVMAATYFGAREFPKLNQATHTAMFLALISGIIMGGAGYAVARPLLTMMSTPPDVIDQATTYVQIYFFGLPFLQIYNFGSAVLRAVGDTRRPLCYLIFAGIINVLLNIYFVVSLHMTVNGVALATIISEAISALLVYYALSHTGSELTFSISHLKLNSVILKKILSIGIPAGVQGCCFSFSNVIIQSAINTFGSIGMAGSAAALTLEGLVYSGSSCYHHTALSFVGQNLGAKNYKRIIRSIYLCIIMGITITSVMGWGSYLLGDKLLGIFNSDPEVISWGLERMSIVMTTYPIIAVMDSLSGATRGLGHSLFTTVIMLFGVCGVRLGWVYFYFPNHRTISQLFISYPLSWLACAIGLTVYLIHLLKTIKTQCAA